jgi:hypothetical protein
MAGWGHLQPAWADLGPTWRYIFATRPPAPPPTQGGSIRIEIAFAATVNLQQITGENPPFTLDDPVLGELDVAELPGGPVWVDVSEWFADGLEISRGRNRAVDLFTAGRAAFRLDNRQRTFDPTNSASPFFGNLTPMRPVRISAVVEGVEERLFQGFVTDWTFRYGRPVDAWVDVDCVDAFLLFASDDLPAVSPVGDEDTSDVRIGRVLDAVGFGPQRNLTAGTFELAETDLSGNALAQMEEAAASDGAFLFVARDGTVTLLNAVTVYAAMPSVTFVQGNVVGETGTRFHDVEVQTAAELLYNRVSVTWDGGTVVRQDTTSIDLYLPRSLSIRTGLKNEADAELLGDFALARFASPELRLRTVTVKAHDRRLTASERVELCRLDVGKVVEVVRRPPGVGTPTQVGFTQVVEGVTWRYARDSWTVTLALGDVVGSPFTLDDAVLGALDTGGILTF